MRIVMKDNSDLSTNEPVLMKNTDNHWTVTDGNPVKADYEGLDVIANCCEDGRCSTRVKNSIITSPPVSYMILKSYGPVSFGILALAKNELSKLELKLAQKCFIPQLMKAPDSMLPSAGKSSSTVDLDNHFKFKTGQLLYTLLVNSEVFYMGADLGCKLECPPSFMETLAPASAMILCSPPSSSVDSLSLVSLCIKTADRPGLLMEVVRAISDISVSVESGEFDTQGLLAKAKFHVSYHGSSLSRPMKEYASVGADKQFAILPKEAFN
eukprot:Gb_00487 [translate_table: standard]